jgi:hypothetical protein
VRIDLHTHSKASDGTDSPAELLSAAVAAGLDVIGLTDHDTAAGWAEAAAALPSGLTLVRGAELSCSSPDGHGGHCTVHLLAYLHDPESPPVAHEQARLRDERRRRLYTMATRMAADGLPVDPDELMASLPPGSSAGRPHLAQVLVRAGVVSSVTEAFNRYLAGRGAYYVPKTDTPVERAIQMIADAGGVTVLAHPFARSRGPIVTAEVIGDLADLGLAGLEIDHPDHDPATRAELRGLADDLELLVTGSSDYHGSNKTVQLGQETTTPAMLDALIERASGVPVMMG